MYALRLRIDNLRSIERAVLDLNAPGRPTDPAVEFDNVNLLLGDNGSGKTTVLMALALGSLAPVIPSGSGYVPYCMVRRVANRPVGVARVEVELTLHAQDGGEGEETLGLIFHPTPGFVDRLHGPRNPRSPESTWEAMWDERSPAFLVLGYGATRRVEPQSVTNEARQKARILRYGRVAGLFEEAVTMVRLASWWPHLVSEQPERHEEVRALLNKLLPNGELLNEAVDGEPLFRLFGSDVPFQALSDGYRAYVGWIADLVYHLHLGTPRGTPLTDSRGIVLVDEVDLHLHPEWQRVVVPALARALPRLQFVFTSHSPLVVGTLRRRNVFVLTGEAEHGTRHTRLQPSREEAYGRSADQILTGDHFGLAGARDASFVGRLKAQAAAAQQGDPEAALQFMRMWALGGAAGDEPDEARVAVSRTPRPASARRPPRATKARVKPAPRAGRPPSRKR
jgi:hypothetical protein